MRCHRVSRNWQTFLASEPALYRTIELFSPRKPLSLASIKRLISLSNDGIGTKNFAVGSMETTFANYYVPGHPEYKSQTHALLRQLFKNLETFSITNHYSNATMDGLPYLHHEFEILPLANLVHINIETFISLKTVARLCQEAPRLEHLGCCITNSGVDSNSPKSFPQLKALSLSISQCHPSQWIPVCGQWFPNLDALTVMYCFPLSQMAIPGEEYEWECNLTQLKTLRLGSSGNHRVLDLHCLSTNLRILDLSGASHLQTIRLPAETHLEELHLESIPRLRADVLSQFHETAESLLHLTISSPQFSAKDIQQFLLKGRNLKSVKINSTSGVTDSTLAILHSLQHLERLEIDNCPEVTGGGIINLIKSLFCKNGGTLRFISLRGNESIRRQTIDWARNQGVIISI